MVKVFLGASCQMFSKVVYEGALGPGDRVCVVTHGMGTNEISRDSKTIICPSGLWRNKQYKNHKFPMQNEITFRQHRR